MIRSCEAFVQKTCKTVTFLHVYRSNNLRNLPRLGHSLVEVAAFLGVRKVLKLEQLQFPILFDDGGDADTVVPESGSIRGGA